MIHFEILTLRTLVVNFGKEKSVGKFVFVVLLIVFIYFGFSISAKDILSYLMIVCLESVDEILEDVSLVCLEMNFEEHVMRNDDSEGHPVERTFLDARLE
jgi:hypothetical protein